jgi:hypothetical protein
MGVPAYETARRYGSGETWQRVMARRWLAQVQSGASGAAVAILDAQVRPTFFREALTARGVTALVDCAPAVWHARLVGGGGQPELMTPDMEAWAAYLRGQADALCLPVLDATSGTVDEALKAPRTLVACMRSVGSALQPRDGEYASDYEAATVAFHEFLANPGRKLR